jgi:hypothetical protein
MKHRSNGATEMTTQDDLSLAKALLDRGELDAAEVLVEKAEHKLRTAQARDHATDDGDDEEPDDDEDDGGHVAKLGPGKHVRYPGDASHEGLSYPEDDLTDAMGEDRQAENPQVTWHGGRTRFDDRVDQVARRDGVPKTVAMQRARKEFGPDYEASQRQPISAAKRAPEPLTDESAVAAQISKGCSDIVAAQRVLAQYGNTLPRSDFAKSATAVAAEVQNRMASEIEQCMRLEKVDRTTAMRKVRLRHPELYDAYQLV